MQRFISSAAKLAVVAAALAGLYVASHYSNDRSVSNWTTSATSSEPKESHSSEPARVTSSSKQRLMAQPGSCESQTWPNISPECITGQAEPAKVAERPAPVPEQPSSILLRPTKLPEAAPELEVTGSLSTPTERLRIREGERSAEVVRRNTRERPVTAKATRDKPEQRMRAEQKTARDAGRRNRPSPMMAVADRAAPEPGERAAEPIQFRLAEGNR
jgi:hypothetical protein